MGPLWHCGQIPINVLFFVRGYYPPRTVGGRSGRSTKVVTTTMVREGLGEGESTTEVEVTYGSFVAGKSVVFLKVSSCELFHRLVSSWSWICCCFIFLKGCRCRKKS